MLPEPAPDPAQNPPQESQSELPLPPIPTSAATKPKRARKPDEPWVPPRGIRYVHRSDRPSAYQLVWTEDGQERKQSFKDEKSREVAAKALAEKREKHGSSILTFDPERWRVFERFTEIVGADTDPLQVAREWKERRGAGSKTTSTLTVSQAIERYLSLREVEGGVDQNYIDHHAMHLRKSLGPHVGHILLHQLSADLLRDWLANLKGRIRKGSTGVLGHEARRHYYRSVHTFLSRCVLEGWIAKSPLDIVVPPRPTVDEMKAAETSAQKRIIAVADAEKLFWANRDQRVVGRLALEAFGGVRYKTAGLMTKEHVNFELKGLAMPGHMHKGRKRKFRQGHPECLWAWLRHAPESCWEMTLRDYYNEKRDAFVRAGVTNPGNGLRHSFASYLLAVTKNLPPVSYLMQHAKTTMTEKYEGRASEQDGKRYLAITPESVAG